MINKPRNPFFFLAACGALMASSASAQLPHVNIDECSESGIALAALPGTPTGSLSVTECRGCSTLRLKFDQRTRFFVGSESVPYASLRQSAARSPALIGVCYDPATRVLTRLLLAATGNNQ